MACAFFSLRDITDSGKGKHIEWAVHIDEEKRELPFIERFDLNE